MNKPKTFRVRKKKPRINILIRVVTRISGYEMHPF